MPGGYVIAAYNDMAKVREPDGEALLIGLEAFIPLSVPIAAGHNVVNVGYGRLEAGGWYLVRRITLVATRATWPALRSKPIP